MPAEIFDPQSVDDLQRIVERRNQAARSASAATGTPGAALVPTPDFMVFVSQLDRRIDTSDPARPLVTMESGATVRKVLTAMRAANVTLPSDVVLGSVQYGGIIATGCHGTGRDQQTLSDLVVAMEIVTGRLDPATGSAEVRRFSVEDGTPADVMSAVRVNLGMFGIIHRITLRAEPGYNVQRSTRRCRWSPPWTTCATPSTRSTTRSCSGSRSTTGVAQDDAQDGRAADARQAGRWPAGHAGIHRHPPRQGGI